MGRGSVSEASASRRQRELVAAPWVQGARLAPSTAEDGAVMFAPRVHYWTALEAEPGRNDRGNKSRYVCASGALLDCTRGIDSVGSHASRSRISRWAGEVRVTEVASRVRRLSSVLSVNVGDLFC